MPGIFISYRRKDQPGFAGRIYDRLEKHFGGIGVFMDDRAIHVGQRFDRVITDKIKSSDLTLVIIGDRWNENDRLNDPDDWVRQEISESLKQPDRTIPILLDDSVLNNMLLPQDLQALVLAQALRISHVGFEDDVRSLINQLRKRLRLWDTETLLTEAATADPSGVMATKLKAILQWAGHRGFQLGWGRGQAGSFWLQPLGAQKTVFSSTSTGESYVYLSALKEMRYLEGEGACSNFIADMNKISNLRIPSDRSAAASFGFQLRSVISINQLIDVLDRTLKQSPTDV